MEAGILLGLYLLHRSLPPFAPTNRYGVRTSDGFCREDEDEYRKRMEEAAH